MLISEIGIRGFKSYGNNEQVLSLDTDDGKLILLVGKNGAGKSSLLDSFDYTLYGKVRGKNKKWATLSTLPNRINGELLNRIKFKSNNIDIEVKRGISPGVLELWENGVLNTKFGKGNLDDKIEEYIGFDIETFKSFISMSINDFKNFISLSSDEKKLLLDKLFNLQIITILNDILKSMISDNKKKLSSIETEINTIEDSISSIQRSINKAIEREKEENRVNKEKEELDIQKEIDRLNTEMVSRKGDYIKLKEKSEKIVDKNAILDNEFEKERKELNNVTNELVNTQKEIDLYDSGKCPTCKIDFSNDHFITLRATLIEKRDKISLLKETIDSNINEIKSKKAKLREIELNVSKSYNDLKYLLNSYKNDITNLTNKKIEQSKVVEVVNISSNIIEFQNTIKELEDKISISKDRASACKDKESYYKELSRIFGDNGVKKSIISGIVKPLNKFIDDNISYLGLPFDVKLDESFNANITQFGNDINNESISTGEQKLINIAILIAYLKMIRTKRHINILFLDEVFASIDVDNINKILILLRSFANEYNINIFVVHHALLSQEMFDRIIVIDKNIFSSINELVYSNE